MSNPNFQILVSQGDITQAKVDAVVTAANEGLQGGGGVDGAVHKAAGPQLLAECNFIGGCRTGSAVLTGGYNLPFAQYVIHAVGPRWKDGNCLEDEQLAMAYYNAMREADCRHISSVAFPCISTGIYGFPPERAVEIAFKAVNAYRAFNQNITRVEFVCFTDADFDLYMNKVLA